MEIYVVQKGDTIEAIAEKYGVPLERLIEDNGLPNPFNLVVGQSIVIVYPEQQYTVQEGDTIESISNANQISVRQLYRNNIFLTDRDYIYPGETLVIRYGGKRGSITTNGYANPFISQDVLKRTLPYLSYLTIFGYRFTEEGEVIAPEDEVMIQLAKDYGVAPIMLLSSLTLQGVGNFDVSYNIIYSKQKTDSLIENIITLLRAKGLYGVNFIYTFLTAEREDAYNRFTESLSERLGQEGFKLIISIPPLMMIEGSTITFERIDYTRIGQLADQVIVMEYNWGYNFNPPVPAASLNTLQTFLNYISVFIPKEKLIIGLPLIGYVWQLPYFIGVTKANSISTEDAIILAMDTGSEISFDEVSQTPYFAFTTEPEGVPKNYIVWFVDARSIAALLDLVEEYKAPGIAIWNIMSYFQQMWLIINTQFEIETLPT